MNRDRDDDYRVRTREEQAADADADLRRQLGDMSVDTTNVDTSNVLEGFQDPAVKPAKSTETVHYLLNPAWRSVRDAIKNNGNDPDDIAEDLASAKRAFLERSAKIAPDQTEVSDADGNFIESIRKSYIGIAPTGSTSTAVPARASRSSNIPAVEAGKDASSSESEEQIAVEHPELSIEDVEQFKESIENKLKSQGASKAAKKGVRETLDRFKKEFLCDDVNKNRKYRESYNNFTNTLETLIEIGVIKDGEKDGVKTPLRHGYKEGYKKDVEASIETHLKRFIQETRSIHNRSNATTNEIPDAAPKQKTFAGKAWRLTKGVGVATGLSATAGTVVALGQNQTLRSKIGNYVAEKIPSISAFYNETVAPTFSYAPDGWLAWSSIGATAGSTFAYRAGWKKSGVGGYFLAAALATGSVLSSTPDAPTPTSDGGDATEEVDQDANNNPSGGGAGGITNEANEAAEGNQEYTPAQPDLTEEEVNKRLQEENERLEREYGISLD
jgi:hypothetical protein